MDKVGFCFLDRPAIPQQLELVQQAETRFGP